MFNLNSPIVSGELSLPKQKKKPWVGKFQYLYLSNRDAKKKNKKPLDPRAIPPLNITISNFRDGKKHYGYVHLITHPTKAGLKIDRLTVKTIYAHLFLSGWWQKKQNQMQTSVKGDVKTVNFGKFLSGWRLSHMLEKGKGYVNFSLRWPGGPKDIALSKVQGSVQLVLSNGRILQLGNKAQSELGLGRFINMFSLQALPRRIFLNFGDLGKKGFQFNSFNGDFALSNGDAWLRKLVLDGPVARISVDGRIGFSKKDYNLTLHIAPYVTSSVPFIVGLIGGPIAGAATWIVNKIASPLIGSVMGFSYRVSGPWKNPIIKKIKKVRRKRRRGPAPVEER